VSDYWNALSGNAPTDLWFQRPSGVGGMPGPQGSPSPEPPSPPVPGTTLNTQPPMSASYSGLPLLSASPPAYAGPPMSANPMSPPPSTPIQPPMNPVDRDTLIKTVAGEAGSEPVAGQAAVAHVILNRLAAGGYGNSITDIAKAPAPGRDGQLGYHEFSMWNPLNKQGNKGGQLDPNSDTYARIGDVVDKAYYGGIPDPTGGATHYYAGAPPKQWPQDWFNSQPKVRIGSQMFVGGPGGPGRQPMVVGALGG
jgi:hypothetical protein